MSLPSPIERQKEVLYLPAKGHTVVLGTAGSGKTTLAILRSAYLSDPQTDHCGKTLLVTFNRALVAYLKYLHDHKLANVVVANYHKFARGYLARRGKVSAGSICDPDLRTRLVAQAIREVAECYEPHFLFNRPVEWFLEEFRWIAQHGIRTPEAYHSIERIGRMVGTVGPNDLVDASPSTGSSLRSRMVCRSRRAGGSPLAGWDAGGLRAAEVCSRGGLCE